MVEAAGFTHKGAAGGTVAFTGCLTLPRLGDLPDRLRALGDVRAIDLSGVERIDTVGAWLVHRLALASNAPITGASTDATRLIEQVGAVHEPVKMRPDAVSPLFRVLGEVGDFTARAGNTLLGLLGFFGAIWISIIALVLHPRRFRANSVVQQFENVGLNALGIVGLMSFLIGIVIAQQGAVQLRQFGAEAFTINLVGRITTRELGVLMTAIMVAGRSGSAFAAQIGTMKLTEEIDAMRTIGVSPTEALVVPRVLSTVLMMPLLAFYASILAIVGGGVLSWLSLGIPPVTYVQRIREVVPMTDVYIGLVKAPVFGFIIALAGCYHGMQVRGDAEEVGKRTTTAVVQAIFLVMVLDAFFAVFFTGIGWN
jgi:phospholipid/cholesterol/gamma-HCH transport system permease protein